MIKSMSKDSSELATEAPVTEAPVKEHDVRLYHVGAAYWVLLGRFLEHSNSFCVS